MARHTHESSASSITARVRAEREAREAAARAAAPPAVGTPINEAPAGGHAETPAGAGGESPRRKKSKVVRTALGLTTVAAVAVGAPMAYFGGNGTPDKVVPTGPNVLTTGGTESAIAAATRNANNGEHGNKVSTLPIVIKLGNQAIKNPIIELAGLPADVAEQAKTGHVDPKALNGHIFSAGQATDNPSQGMEHDFNRLLTPIDVSQVTGVEVPPGTHIVDVSLDWEHPGNIGLQPGTANPYEQNAAGQVGQFDGQKHVQPYIVGAPVTPQG